MIEPASEFLLPQSVREVATVIGRHLALLLAGEVFHSRDRCADGKRNGRHGRVYIPASPRGRNFDRLSSIVGEESARALVHALGGSELRFGACAALVNRVRDASVRDYWRNSTLSARWVAWMHDITERQVRNITAGEPRLALCQAQVTAREAA
ncbi:hypothetical protein [Xanthomonas sp. SI]|uniref:hypothetical protein n=1 Tax=Xanthomonas sp. SI TaxID=2724123 RepID=UPI00163B55F6|nr:hypothetical protein [Xanthomonas sp. SI]